MPCTSSKLHLLGMLSQLYVPCTQDWQERKQVEEQQKAMMMGMMSSTLMKKNARSGLLSVEQSPDSNMSTITCATRAATKAQWLE